jgi:hypothetical protein
MKKYRARGHGRLDRRGGAGGISMAAFQSVGHRAERSGVPGAGGSDRDAKRLWGETRVVWATRRMATNREGDRGERSPIPLFFQSLSCIAAQHDRGSGALPASCRLRTRALRPGRVVGASNSNLATGRSQQHQGAPAISPRSAPRGPPPHPSATRACPVLPAGELPTGSVRHLMAGQAASAAAPEGRWVPSAGLRHQHACTGRPSRPSRPTATSAWTSGRLAPASRPHALGLRAELRAVVRRRLRGIRASRFPPFSPRSSPSRGAETAALRGPYGTRSTRLAPATGRDDVGGVRKRGRQGPPR